jgi:hypothetical protein
VISADPGNRARRDSVVNARARFYLEAILATLTTGLFALTLVSRDWIEIVFGIEPDQSNGTLEWVIVGVLLAVSVALIALARRDWRRVQSSAV